MGFQSKSEFQEHLKAGPSAECDQMVVLTGASVGLFRNVSDTAAEGRAGGRSLLTSFSVSVCLEIFMLKCCWEKENARRVCVQGLVVLVAVS